MGTLDYTTRVKDITVFGSHLKTTVRQPVIPHGGKRWFACHQMWAYVYINLRNKLLATEFLTPEDDPVGPKHVTRIKIVYTSFSYIYVNQ